MADASRKKPRLQGKLVKHAAPSQFKYSNLQTTVRIQHKTPYISAIKRVDTMMKALKGRQPKKSYITVLGMGATIEKTMNIGVHFQAQGCRVEVLTKSVEVLDEFLDQDDSDDESVLRKRSVSCVELKVYKPFDLQ
ncbi:unnamed protein product [Cyberlindnera jadinii]|uniref:Uncharacterized protein n=1 Tax=Cyberlindnera jadinii (strain ATCC 18201 / CBS 1600 / BCRC 20928 / JCM 3617 / NBRC 0987 / NRRL Y-1542) TaxID=983966 RepID=A0A0H5BZG9_CYBJN|nr:unnamed protein product [Cyberlindnera jadinii]